MGGSLECKGRTDLLCVCQSGLGKQLWDDGRTRKIVQRPLKRTADSTDYLAGQPRLPDGRRRPCIGRSTL